jgi:hypothetical protein
MDRPNWDKQRPSKDEMFDDKVRQIMFKRRITYQEAAELVKAGQKAIFEF